MQWHLSKDTNFDVRNCCIISNPEKDIFKKVLHTYNLSVWRESVLTDSIWDEMCQYDFGNFYVPDSNGRKNRVTTILKKIITKNFKEHDWGTKAIVDQKFAKLGKEISEIYSPEYQITAFWGNKSLIGEGKYESDMTCFGTGADNEGCRRFIVVNKRLQVLVLQNDKGGKGRCLVYFAGGRNIFLFNFYIYKMDIPPIIWAESVRRLFNLPHITFKTLDDEFDLELPIYQNGDTVLVYDKKSIIKPTHPKKFVCPSCFQFTDKKALMFDEEGGYNAQCPTCQKLNKIQECDGCGMTCPPSDMIKMGEDNFCLHCATQLIQCGVCGRASTDDGDFEIHDSGIPVCINCAKYCQICHNLMIPSEVENIVRLNGKIHGQLCLKCGKGDK